MFTVEHNDLHPTYFLFFLSFVSTSSPSYPYCSSSSSIFFSTLLIASFPHLIFLFLIQFLVHLLSSSSSCSFLFLVHLLLSSSSCSFSSSSSSLTRHPHAPTIYYFFLAHPQSSAFYCFIQFSSTTASLLPDLSQRNSFSLYLSIHDPSALYSLLPHPHLVLFRSSSIRVMISRYGPTEDRLPQQPSLPWCLLVTSRLTTTCDRLAPAGNRLCLRILVPSITRLSACMPV